MRILLTIAATAVIITMLFWTRPESFAELQELPPPTVKIEQVSQVDIQPVNRVTGKLQPARTATLQFQVSGQVNTRLVEPGEYVEKGSELLTIEEGDYVDAVQESLALLKNEQDAIDRDSRLLELIIQERKLQEQEVQRLEQLDKDSLTSKSLYEQSLQELYRLQGEEARLKHGLESSRSRLMIEQARLNIAERNLQRTRLVAPFSGVVNSINVDVGDYVSPNQAALDMVQVDSLDLNVEITGAMASRLQLGQEINIDTRTDRREGKIISLSVDPDPLTNTHSLKIRIPSEGLYPGELAEAYLPGTYYQDAFVVPLGAILYEDGKTFVFTLKDNTLSREPVRLIERYNDQHIVEGVSAGTRIVSRDVSSLADGQTVNVH